MNAEEILQAAIEKKAPAERAAFLEGACGRDTELRALVEGLLKSHEQAGSFLEQPLFQSEATVDQPAPGERLGTQIGPYKLLQQIGEGGMGTVFMAEQTEPVKRWVALKIIKPGMDSQQVIARFEAERQALALMDHPNIAKVLDAGTVGQAFQPDVDLQSQARKPNLRGRSYFVMELVKGVPITQYCDEHHLTPRDRLDLFVHVCQAVQHAHTKGIIHRDLKPSNVLVAEYDDRPVPKVIDFGVAKATGAKLSAQTLSTQFGQLVGTLEYMSPEQAKLNALDIDTRSDIYALGVLLYELLTGSTPFEKRRLHAVAFDEVLRLIREEEPAKPSTRLSTTEGLRSIAANRGLEPKKLSGVVRGELDWIAMRCLEKDRNRRYETANALAMDVERYLNDEPVRAGPPSAGYRLRKFAKRNRGPVLAAAAVLVALVAGVIGTSLGLVRAVQSKLEAVAARQEETRLRRQAEQGQRREAELREQADQGRKREAGLRVEAEESQRRETMLRKRAETAFELSRRNLYAASIFAAQRAAVAGGVRRANELLDELRPKWGEQDLREWEWYYLDSLTNTNPRGGTAPQLEGHAGQVRTLAWSPDGSRLASAGYDGLIKVWELQTGTAVSLAGHTAPAYTVDWKSDGSRLVSCGQDGTIRTWDAVQGELLRTVIAHSGREVNFVAFSPDDSRIASAGDDGTVKLWDAETCRPVGTLTGHRAHEVTSVAWSRDGSRLASCGYDGLVKVWDAATLSESYEFVRSGEYLWAVAFSPDSRRLAAAGGFAEYAPMSSVGTITVWDLESRAPVFTRAGHSQFVNSISFNREGSRVLSGAWDGTVKVWTTEGGQELITLAGPGEKGVMSVRWSPDGTRIAAAGEGKGILLWDVTESFVRDLRPELLSALDRRIATHPTLDELKLRGEVRARLGRWDDAAVDFEQAVRLPPGDRLPPAWFETTCWVVGPYAGELRAACPPEADPNPFQPVAAGGSKGQPSNDMLTWQPVHLGGDGLSLGRMFHRAENSSAYALVRVYSPREQRAGVLLGSDDQVRLWLNGQLVHENLALRMAAPDQDTVSIVLEPGWNSLLAKVWNWKFNHALFLRLSDDPVEREAEELLDAKLKEGGDRH